MFCRNINCLTETRCRAAYLCSACDTCSRSTLQELLLIVCRRSMKKSLPVTNTQYIPLQFPHSVRSRFGAGFTTTLFSMPVVLHYPFVPHPVEHCSTKSKVCLRHFNCYSFLFWGIVFPCLSGGFFEPWIFT